MSVLTKQERDGLEDVFLSIHAGKRVSGLSSFIIASYINSVFQKVTKHAKIGLKKRKRIQFLLYFSKKKKHLSK
ncbi:hypothetical protein [Sulfurimonas sp.]|uniref:hypothetical protein n=1 Tax=Sulfurimonas sp. TaxID=2022749 RepID=UPI0025EA1D19|nr:hypothetical protein [Sulfurimonas sp.]MDD5158320.1 hypothetical protein [Sulfurimonas sp.]